MRPIEPDFFYRLDQFIANRPDGGTVSDSLSEFTGVSKSTLHKGMVGAAGLTAAMQLVNATNDPFVLLAGLAAITVASAGVYAYMEAPRTR